MPRETKLAKRANKEEDLELDDEAANDVVLTAGEVHKLEMTHTKETKGTHVYSTENEDAFCTTVYIKKGKLPKKAPKKIVLALKF